MLDQYAAMEQHAMQHPSESTYAGTGDLAQLKMRPDLHGPQDYQSLLMHLEAVRMLKEDPSLAARSLDALARWDATMTHHSKPLRDRWVQIINEKDWALATEESELGNQLRQASPLAILLPNEVRYGIIRHVRKLKDAAKLERLAAPIADGSEFAQSSEARR